MLSNAENLLNVTPICATALEFARGSHAQIDGVFSCEAVHHFGKNDLREIFGLLKERLKKGGKIVIEKPSEKQNGVLPVIEIARNRPVKGLGLSTSELVAILKEVFSEVQVETLGPLKLTLEKASLFRAIRLKYASTLAGFSQREIEDGIEQMNCELRGESDIEWSLTKDIVVATDN